MSTQTKKDGNWNSPVYSNTYSNKGFVKQIAVMKVSEGDDNAAIGTILHTMEDRPIPKGYLKVEGDFWEFYNLHVKNKGTQQIEKKCDCGIEKTYGKMPLNSHSNWCKLRESEC